MNASTTTARTMGIHHAGLTVRDLTAASDFFEQAPDHPRGGEAGLPRLEPIAPASR